MSEHHRSKQTAGLAIGGAGFALLLYFSGQTVDGAREGLILCGTAVIPSLFPFFVLSNFLIRSGGGDLLAGKLSRFMQALFGIAPQGASAVLFGLLGGYPLGAATVAELYQAKQISKADAGRLLRFCSNTGPSFFVGAVGLAVFHSAKAGLLLYAIHAVGALLTGVLLCGRAKQTCRVHPTPKPAETLGSAFSGAVGAACRSMLSISAFVVFFSAALHAIGPLLGAEHPAVALLTGLLEMTSGVLRLRDCPPLTAFWMAELMVSFGGLCVHFQATSLLRQAGLPCRDYWRGKALHGLLSGALAWPVGLWYFEGKPLLLPLAAAVVVLAVLLTLAAKKQQNRGSFFPNRSV